MLGLFALLFLVAPIVELYVIVQVAGGIGIPETILLLVVVSMVGAWLAKQQGLSVLRRFQAVVAQGKVPSGEIVDGALIILAGALMIAPGFLSDCLAILLLLPPTRALVRSALLRRIRSGTGFITVISGAGHTRATTVEDLWDVEGWEDPPAPPDRPQLGP